MENVLPTYSLKRNLFFIVAIMFLLALPTISAFEFDNNQNIKDTIGKAGYNDIEIKNNFGFGKTLWSGTLDSNTETCGQSCSATQTITLYEKGSLVDEIIFKTLQEDKSWIEQPIRSYQIYYRLKGNDKWINYILGTEIDAGIYEVKLEGSKKPTRTVEWIYKSQGEWLDAWAFWGGDLFIGLIGYYSLDDGSGSIAEDNYLGNYNGTFSGAPTWVSGKLGGAVEGVNNAMNTTYIPYNTAQTYSFWMLKDTAATNGLFGTTDSGAGGGGFLTSMGNDEKISLLVHDGGGWSIENQKSAETISVETWTHIVYQYNTTTVLVWKNGVRMTFVDDVGVMASRSSNLFFFSAGGGNEKHTNVSIDEIGMWNRSLSDAEVQLLYNGGAGLPFRGTNITLNSPIDNYNSSTTNIIFNSTATMFLSNLTNMSLWHNGTGTWHRNQTEDLVGTTNTSILNSTFPDGNYLWTFEACDVDGDCDFATENRTFLIDTEAPTVNITYPYGSVDYADIGGNLTINWTWSDPNIDSCWYEYGGVNTTIDCDANTTGITLENSTDTEIIIWINDSVGNENSSTITWDYRAFQNNVTWNETSYKTKTDGYIINISSNGNETITASLYYNNTAVTATKTGDNEEMIFTSEIGAQEYVANQSFYWEITHGATLFNTSTYYQDVDSLTFVLCNATNGATFINFTFQDENTFTDMNATFQTSNWVYYLGDGSVTNTLSYTNLTSINNSNYAFCCNVNETLYNTATIRYAETNYPQRIHIRSTDLTNTVTDQLLYLLASADGIYTTMHTQDSQAQAIADVNVLVERKFNETYVTIGLDSTDAAGGATFWVNPNYDHRFTFTKTDYTTVVYEVRPTQSDYTIIMEGGVGTQQAAAYTGSLAGITWSFYPRSGIIEPGLTNFTFNVTAENSNIISCKFAIRNSTQDNLITNSSGCNATGGSVLIENYNVTRGSKFWGAGWIDVGDGLFMVDGDAYWIAENITTSGLALIDIAADWLRLSLFGDSDDPAEANKVEFGRVLFAFVLIILFLGVVSAATGWDLATAGGCILLIYPLVLLFSFFGWFTFAGLVKQSWIITSSAATWLNQYIFALMASFFSFGYLLNYWSKNS